MATPTHNLVSEPLAIGRRGTAVISDMPECPYAGGNVKCEKRALPNAVAFRPLTLQLACATDSGGLFPRALFRRVFIVGGDREGGWWGMVRLGRGVHVGQRLIYKKNRQ